MDFSYLLRNIKRYKDLYRNYFLIWELFLQGISGISVPVFVYLGYVWDKSD